MLKLPNLRELALECLLQKAGNTPFPVLLEKAFAQIPAHGHSSQDRACLMALCYGVLRNAGLLKQICLSHCKKKSPVRQWKHASASPCLKFFS